MTKKPPAPSDIADKFMLRMPDGMRDRIAESAKANNRSMNSEIIARLDASFETDRLNSDIRNRLEELAERQETLDERISRLEKS